MGTILVFGIKTIVAGLLPFYLTVSKFSESENGKRKIHTNQAPRQRGHHRSR
jgi:hypothetical protein